MTTLENFGWNSFHDSYFKMHAKDDVSAGRIISIKGFKYSVIGAGGEIEAELSGRLLFAASPDDLPKVGDWVFYMDYGAMGYIIEVFPRINELSRKNPGAKLERQILATNIDLAFVVQGLDQNFNLMRLERYLVQLSACNIKTIVVLNKSDLVEDVEPFKTEIARLGRDVPVIACSTFTNTGLEQFLSTLISGNTHVLIGSSGVGKSSLVNYAMKIDVQKTSGTSDANEKGRHTTTSRELFKLANGSLLIDTPGMREFGVTGSEGHASSSMFPLIDKFASSCRFGDCTHLNELGCAVLNAIDTGELDAMIYDSYRKLLKEQRRFEISAEDKKRLGKQWGKITREANNHRKKYKG